MVLSCVHSSPGRGLKGPYRVKERMPGWVWGPDLHRGLTSNGMSDTERGTASLWGSTSSPTEREGWTQWPTRFPPAGTACRKLGNPMVPVRDLTLDLTTSSTWFWSKAGHTQATPATCPLPGTQAREREWMGPNPLPLGEKKLRAHAGETPGQVMARHTPSPADPTREEGGNHFTESQVGEINMRAAIAHYFLRTREWKSKVRTQHNHRWHFHSE